jgi:hypothetical protein
VLINRWPYFWGTEIASMPGFREIDISFIANALPTLPYDTVYLYTVVNDYINPPAYSLSAPFSLDNYREISGHIKLTNGSPAANVPVILSRASVADSKITTHTDAQGQYAFYNSPHNTDVLIQIPAPEGHYFTTDMFVNRDFEARELQAADWLELTLHTGPEDNVTADFQVTDQPVAVYGAVYDTGYVSIPGVWVFVMNENGTVLAQQQTNASGFAFFNLPAGKLQLSMTLPTDENGYHWLTQDITSGASIKERIDSFSYNGVPLKLDYSARSGNGPFFHFYNAGNNHNLSGGKLELINTADPDNMLFSILSKSNGLVSFDEQDLIPGQEYEVIVTPPAGYHCQNNSCLMTFTWDGFYQEFIPLPMTEN